MPLHSRDFIQLKHFVQAGQLIVPSEVREEASKQSLRWKDLLATSCLPQRERTLPARGYAEASECLVRERVFADGDYKVSLLLKRLGDNRLLVLACRRIDATVIRRQP